MSEIVSIFAREILDSRGNPTVEADVVLASGAQGSACAHRQAPQPVPEKRWNCETRIHSATPVKACKAQ